MISERPAEAEDRAVRGHWEGDLIIGLNRSAIGTVVERSTRFTLLVHLPRMEGYGVEPGCTMGRRSPIDTRLAIYFADPHSPWQRGIKREHQRAPAPIPPKGTDLSRWSRDEVEAVAAALKARPRKTLGWKTPAEAFDEHLRSLQQAGVATTG